MTAEPLTPDTYAPPEHGWTCFHCGETFTTENSARLHFGGHKSELAACQIKAADEKGLVKALRWHERDAELSRKDAATQLADRNKWYDQAVALKLENANFLATITQDRATIAARDATIAELVALADPDVAAGYKEGRAEHLACMQAERDTQRATIEALRGLLSSARGVIRIVPADKAARN